MSEIISVWTMRGLGGAEFIHVDNLCNPTPAQVSLTYKLVYFEQGIRSFHYRRQHLQAGTGQLLAVAPGEVHRADAGRGPGVTLRILSLHETTVAEVADEFGRRHRSASLPLDPFMSSSVMIDEFRRLHRNPRAFTSLLEQQTRLVRLIESLHKDTGGSVCHLQNESGPVQRVKRYIEDRYVEDISLTQLARSADLAHAYLCRAFAKSVGMPPHAYLVAVRVAHARSFLQQGYSVGQAAQKTGFYDQAHFTRHFRRILGVTPARYARDVNFVQDCGVRSCHTVADSHGIVLRGEPLGKEQSE